MNAALLDIDNAMDIKTAPDQVQLEVDVDTLVALVSANPPVLRISAAADGQELGQIVQDQDRQLRIVPAAGSPLEGIDPGTYADRGAAMAAISAHLNGTCLHARPATSTSPTPREA